MAAELAVVMSFCACDNNVLQNFYYIVAIGVLGSIQVGCGVATICLGDEANETRGVDFVRHDKGYDRVWVSSVDTSSPVPAEWTDMTGCGGPYDSAPVNLTGPFNCSAHDDGPVFDLSTVTGSYVGKSANSMEYSVYQALRVNNHTKSYRYDSGQLGTASHQYTLWAFENEGYYIESRKGCKKAEGLTYANMMKSYGPDSMQWMGEGTITDMELKVSAAKGKKVNMYAGVTPSLNDVPDILDLQMQVIAYTDAETGQYLGMDINVTPSPSTISIWWDEFTTSITCNVEGDLDLPQECTESSGGANVGVSGVMVVLAAMVSLLDL